MKSPLGKATALLAALMVVLGTLSFGVFGPGTAAQAYQVPIANPTFSNGIATLTTPVSGLNAAFGASGLTEIVGGSTLDSRGYVASDYSPGLAGSRPTVSILTHAINNCAATGPCSDLGTFTINFSQPVMNPVLSLAGLGGNVNHDEGTDGTIDRMSQIHAVLGLTTPGLSLTKMSGGNLAVSGNSITAINHSTSARCQSTAQLSPAGSPDAGATAACGSVRVNGLVSSLTFDMSAVFTRTTSSLPGYSVNDRDNSTHNQDGFVMTLTAAQDFGDAPASYDQNNAASAILSDVTMGASVTEDNAQVANGTASPNAGATAALDQDNGLVLAPLALGATNYSTSVALSGASKAGTTCGWIDFDKDGIFDNPAERSCAAFAAGATSATLTWATVPAGLTAGTTYARFRVGYTASQIQLPTGASNSGEVEDYVFTFAPAPAPSMSLLKTVNRTTLVAGQTATYTFVATNTGNVALTGVVIAETQFSGTGSMSALAYSWPGVSGTLLAGQSVTATATYVVTQSDVTAGVLTNTARVTGTPPVGAPITATSNATVTAPPAWTMQKAATVGGTATPSVSPGQTIVYTVTATSTSGQISGIVLTDNLADVLDQATFVAGSATLKIGTAAATPVANPANGSTTLTTTAFTLPAGLTATLTYSVVVKADAWSEELVNTVTGSGSVAPARCATGVTPVAPECMTTHRATAKFLIEKLGESSDSSWVPMSGSSWAVRSDAGGAPGAGTDYTVSAITGQTGRFQVEAIQPGTYWLEETKAPSGFNLLAEAVRFTVAPDGAITLGQGDGAGVVTTGDQDGDGIFLVSVRDVPALQMPETGGIGYWPFALAGSATLLAAAVLASGNLRRRKSQPANS
ncbi:MULTISPECIES: GEVED domain-containing protein [unclassified Arthrobacter]|uniref:DUF7507 domain-containing protein n=1 Tax=unclassified Arthrobacter TaxID=235627 RepID=UPI00288C0F60|nr:MULTISPECIES: GEVED domain-containing protein [unclassified Arthrobacter]